jgi:hypothetical protein
LISPSIGEVARCDLPDGHRRGSNDDDNTIAEQFVALARCVVLVLSGASMKPDLHRLQRWRTEQPTGIACHAPRQF